MDIIKLCLENVQRLEKALVGFRAKKGLSTQDSLSLGVWSLYPLWNVPRGMGPYPKFDGDNQCHSHQAKFHGNQDTCFGRIYLGSWSSHI